MSDHYLDTLRNLLKQNLIHTDMNVLVVCGTGRDRDVLREAGFYRGTISGLDSVDANEFFAIAWSSQDVEGMTFRDDEFDFCIVHDGLHHCAAPHRALLEMYRVARIGVLAFEPADSFMTRLGVRLNFGQDYEIAAVSGNNYRGGGVKNTIVPSYVYRWTKREIEKTICTYTPWGRPRFVFIHELRFPWGRLRMMKSKLPLVTLMLAAPFLKLAALAFPGFANTFAFSIFKPRIPEDLQPWIKPEGIGITLNREWVETRYPPPKAK